MIGRAAALRGAVALLVLFATPACRGGGASGPVPVPVVAVDPSSTSPVDQRILTAQAALARTAGDDTARLDLATALLQKVRETADPALYAQADILLDDLVRRRPDDPQVLVAAATLALARHEFRDALALGERAAAAAPGSGAAEGILVDANNELGRYDEAVRATQAMADAKPDLSALARVSYARELRGDLQGAIAAMSQAVTAGRAAGGGENLAYVQALLGQLLLTTGRVDEAERTFADAESSFPGFAPAAVGHARVAIARGDLRAAADRLDAVVAKTPLVEYVIEQAEVAEARGDRAAVDQAVGLIDAIARVFRANGVNVDLELAVFAADHKGGASSVEQARRALKDRPGVQAHDGLAWNLFRAGRLDEAWSEATAALALGWKDPRARYHAAAIAEARGDLEAARTHLGVVLDTNPAFAASRTADVRAMAGRLGLPSPEPSAP